MSVTSEIDALKKIVEDLTSLEPEARQRVVDYACNVLGIGRTQPRPPTRTEIIQGLPTVLAPSGKPTAPQQYLRNYSYKIMTKRIAVIAVYLERERGMKRFGLRDITDAFRDAKESKAPAHSQYARAVAMGYLAKEGDQLYATTKAEELVDSYNAHQAEDDKEGE